MVKKLMMLFAAVALAGAAQAAVFSWNNGGIYDSSGTTLYNGPVVIMAYWGDMTAASAVQAATATAWNGEFTAGGMELEGEDNSVLYTFYVVITDGDKVFDSSKAGVTTSSTPSDLAFELKRLNSVVFSTATQNSANWTAVPEPTSGLLLLVGGALLALRRKRLR